MFLYSDGNLGQRNGALSLFLIYDLTSLYYGLQVFQKQPPEVFYKKDVLKNFAKLTGKRLCQSLFLIKLQA